MVGFMGNYLLPLRAGEIMRVVSIGQTQNIRKSSTLGSIVLERVLDGITHGGVQAPFDNLPIMGSEEVWEAPVNDDGYPHDAAEVRRAAWGDMTAGVMPVYSEWYWDFFKGNGKGEPDVRRMFNFFIRRPATVSTNSLTG